MLFATVWLIDFVGIAILTEHDLRWSLAFIPLLAAWLCIEKEAPDE